MLNPFASFGIYIAEMLIAYLYFSGFLEQRRPTWQCLLLGGLCFTGASALNLLFRNNTVLNLCTSFLAPLLFALSCYRGRLPLKAFYALIFAVLGGTIETAVVAFGATVTGNGFLDYNTNTPLFLLEAISCKGLTFLAVLVAVRFLNPNKSAVKVPPVFLLYPLIGTFCIFIFWRVRLHAGESDPSGSRRGRPVPLVHSALRGLLPSGREGSGGHPDAGGAVPPANGALLL